MTEQWQELKETITEMCDSNGTCTQQEVCKFLVNYMEILEKQMQEPCEDAISRQAVLDINENHHGQMPNHVKHQIWQEIKDLPSVRPQEPFDIDQYCKEHFCVMVDKDVWEKAEKALKQEPKLGHWKAVPYNSKHGEYRPNKYACSKCGWEIDLCRGLQQDTGHRLFCEHCGAKMKVGD